MTPLIGAYSSLTATGSHTQGVFIFECLINQALIVYLLPHTSHLSQPCDLGPFCHLKSYYSKNLKSFIAPGDTQVNSRSIQRPLSPRSRGRSHGSIYTSRLAAEWSLSSRCPQ